ncbi:MAG: AAA family ATPase [Phycisphaerae bacterium]|nr:AAA family ATPase [Phycisphaerae bacterium]
MAEVRKVIVGQDRVVEDVITAFFAGGNCLLISVPGLAKTLLISTLGRAVDLTFRRVQFTPDLMPSDITGTEVLEENRDTGQRHMTFRRGPIFTNILLADEINRTPPKTQAALLEAMQQHQVTVGGQTHHLEEPFFVLATQNPVEQEGTYPLPALEQDRFMFTLLIDYLPRDQEKAVVSTTTARQPDIVQKCLDREELLKCQAIVHELPVVEPVLRYAVALVSHSRPDHPKAPEFVREYVAHGASLRGAHYLALGAKARALLSGRPHVSLDDVRSVAHIVLRHRLLTNFRAESQGVKPDTIIDQLLEHTPAPESTLS